MTNIYLEVGKLYRIKGTIPIKTGNGYIMGAYAYMPRLNIHEKDTLSNVQPLIENGTIALLVDIPEKDDMRHRFGVHVLIGDRVHYMLASNLEPL